MKRSGSERNFGTRRIAVGGNPAQAFAAAKAAHDRTATERQIAATDEEIDHLVYELYGLTKDEIAIVEGAAE